MWKRIKAWWAEQTAGPKMVPKDLKKWTVDFTFGDHKPRQVVITGNAKTLIFTSTPCSILAPARKIFMEYMKDVRKRGCFVFDNEAVPFSDLKKIGIKEEENLVEVYE
jgi:hypothetical protein